MSTIVLDSSNIEGTDNNTLVYKFPNSVKFDNHEIAVQSVTMYYSWENINDTTLSNNVFSIQWVSGTTVTTYPIVIPSGLYEVIDLNNYLQFFCIQHGLFLIDENARFVYYAEMVVNAQQYAVQVNTFPVPLTLPLNWTAPVSDPVTGQGAWPGFPTATFNPSLIFPAKFNEIVGYAVNFATGLNQAPSPTAGQNLSFYSSVSPQVQPNSSIYLSLSNINNKYAVPSSIVYSISPTVAFGEQINSVPPNFTWNRLLNGTYNEIRLQILGLNKQPLILLDGNMTIMLSIRDLKESGLTDIVNRLQGNK